MNEKIIFVSLGCDKNLVDTEMMLSLLRKEGYSFTDDEREADIAVINTCCFIGDAKEESVNTILEFAEYKKSGQIRSIIVTGCLAQRYRREILTEIEEVDAVIGTTAVDKIAEAVRAASGAREYYADINRAPLTGTGRIMTTGGCYSYLKIAEGCDKHCTYCIIPKVRGSYRSVPMEPLVAEAAELVSHGVKELILVAQETTLYGVDLYGRKSLPELLRRLNDIEGLAWIRIMYCYPEEIDDALIRAVKELPKVCHYLDIPVQHAADGVLARMGRRTTGGQLYDVVTKLRREIPDICIRTTFITGFPGETEEDHQEAMDFINDLEFDRLGVFPYSMEEDTPAALMDGQISEDVKLAYRDEIMELQQAIAFEKAEQMVGQTLEAMVEGKVTEPFEDFDEEAEGSDGEVYVARTYRDAPGIDGLVFIRTGRVLMSGDFVKVRITGANEYDLIGVIEDEFTE